MREKKREPGIWFDPSEPELLFPKPGTPEHPAKLIAGDMAVVFYDPVQDRVPIILADNLDRYKDLRTPFYGYIRGLIREQGLRDELGSAKVKEIECRAKHYPYYKEKAQFKALSRIQLNQPIPVQGQPGKFWWSPEKLGKRQPVRSGTPGDRQEIYDREAEQWAKWLILRGQFLELASLIDREAWCQQADL